VSWLQAAPGLTESEPIQVNVGGLDGVQLDLASTTNSSTHIWLSPALAAKQTGAFIERRTRLTGDGSDHDPAWAELEVREWLTESND